MNLKDKLVLRLLREGDAGSLAEAANNFNVWKMLADRMPHPYSQEDAATFIEVSNSEGFRKNEHAFCMDIDGQIAGMCGLVFRKDIHKNTAVVGYWVAEKYWGCGLASEAVRRLTQMAFAEYGKIRVQAEVFAGNMASVRVLEKNGFVQEAHFRNAAVKCGEVLDLLVFAKLRG